MSGYQKRISWTFEAGGDLWEVFSFTNEVIDFEETRKNGQEDCHTRGSAERVDGRWVLEEWTRSQINTYGRTGQADAIEAFFNEHGLPESNA